MLVDNLPPSHPFTDLSDIFNTDLFADSVFTTATTASHSPAPASSSSRASSPQSPDVSFLLTPPHPTPPHSFPDLTPSSFFNFLDDDHTSKPVDPMMSIMSMAAGNPYDFISAFGAGAGGIDMDASMMGMDVGPPVFDPSQAMSALVNPNTTESIGIDPQLVGTPATSRETDCGPDDEDEDAGAHDDEDDHDGDVSASPDSSATAASPPAAQAASKKSKDAEPEKEKLTLLIQPVKVGGKGKARKGTVQSGGIVKKSATVPVAVASQDKENAIATATTAGALPPPPEYRLPAAAYMPTNLYPAKVGKQADDKDDDDDLPQDWRPPPEVFQKMTSKEKRQLRNKISARNFRVRRKEYISTLEGDIAERDRLLDAIRSELGSTQSENYALRQEIATLKRVLLDGRSGSAASPAPASAASLAGATPADVLANLNLPPPAPLPAQSAAEVLARAQALAQAQAQAAPAAATVSPSTLLMPNIQKDVSSSSSHFWGGASTSALGGMRFGGGITPVHRVVMPEMGVMDALAQIGALGAGAGGEKLQENLNPLLNNISNINPTMALVPQSNTNSNNTTAKVGFDGYADMNMFTMKTMDAYRMHLWGKMAAMRQHQQQQQQHQAKMLTHQPHQPHLTGLASSLRPAFFATPTPGLGSLLSGKHHITSPYSYPHSLPPTPPPPYQSTPPSPVMLAKHTLGGSTAEKEREKEREREREKEREAMVAAALASQTLLKKLGGAFWEAFAGSSSSAVSSGGSGQQRAWDADKVRRVLEGKAVVRVVDVDEPLSALPGPLSFAPRDVGLGAGLARRDRGVGVPATAASSTGPTSGSAGAESSRCLSTAAAKKCCADILEEGMRSLSLGKKA